MCGSGSNGCAPKCCQGSAAIQYDEEPTISFQGEAVKPPFSFVDHFGLGQNVLPPIPESAYAPDAVELEESILAEAEKVVNGPRAVHYGPPSVNFQRIADLWDAWLVGRPDRNAPISVYDVAYMMILMKLARLQHQPYHRDSVVDIAGYAGCAEKLARDLGDS